MTVRESIKNEIDLLPDDVINLIKEFVLFQKYRDIFEAGDTAYLSGIPGMFESIQAGVNTPVSECVPVSEVWPDV